MSTHDVFISYKSEDYTEALWLKNILEINNISSWMAPSSIPGGSNYAHAIPEAIANCKIFLLLVSEKTQKSIWVSKEINQAINEKKIIMPYVIENCELHNEFKFYLTDIQRYDAFINKSNAIKKMVSEIWAILGIKTPVNNIIISDTPEDTTNSYTPDHTNTPDFPKKKSKFDFNLFFNIMLTAFLCCPAGLFITVLYFVVNPHTKNKKRFKKIIGILCAIGSLIGISILLCVAFRYSHLEEALYSSIIGLIIKVAMGDF